MADLPQEFLDSLKEINRGAEEIDFTEIDSTPTLVAPGGKCRDKKKRCRHRGNKIDFTVRKILTACVASIP